MQHRQQAVQQALHTAGLIKVLQIVGAAGLQVGNQRDFVRTFIKERPPITIHPSFVCNGRNMQQQVGGTGHGDVCDDRVFDGFFP